MAGEVRGRQECSLPRAIIIVLTVLFGHLIAAKNREYDYEWFTSKYNIT